MHVIFQELSHQLEQVVLWQQMLSLEQDELLYFALYRDVLKKSATLSSSQKWYL